MSDVSRRPVPGVADDGDEFHFCSTCAFSAACLESGYDKSLLRDLHVLVEHIGPFHEGEHIFREGDPFTAIAAVRSGTVKTYVTDHEGREHVQGFFLPGEVIGLNAISQARYPSNAIALDSVVLCRFSFPNIAALATRMPGLQQAHTRVRVCRAISTRITLPSAIADRTFQNFKPEGDFTNGHRRSPSLYLDDETVADRPLGRGG